MLQKTIINPNKVEHQKIIGIAPVKLTKDVPTVFKTFLEQILCFDEVWSHMAKSAIFAIFGEN